MRLFTFFIVSMVLVFLDCSFKKGTHQNELSSKPKSFGYWDAGVGWSWYIGPDSSFREYEYDAGKRVWVTVDDVIMGWSRWSFKNDTLFIGPKSKYRRAYPIVQWDEKYLRIVGSRRAWGKDTLSFYFSSDQKTIPE